MRLADVNHYQLLRVTRHVTRDDLRAAFHRFAIKYHPDNFADDDEERRSKAALIFAAGSLAYQCLSDPEQKSAYDTALSQGTAARVAKTLEPAALTPNGPDSISTRARPFYDEALQALRQGRNQNARFNLRLALQYDGDNTFLRDAFDELDDSENE